MAGSARRRSWGFALTLLCVLAAWFGASSVGQGFVLDTSPGRDVYHVSTVFEVFAGHVLDGHLPLWLPEFQGGFPLPAASMYGVLYPPVLLFGLLPAELAWTWVSILHLTFAGVGLYLFLAETCQDANAAMVGALIFTLSEFMVGRVLFGGLPHIMTVAWAPWVLLCIDRCADGRRAYAGWLALCFGAALFAGHVQLWFYLGPLVVAYGALRARASDDPRRSAQLMVGGLTVGLGVASFQWFQTAQLFLLSDSKPTEIEKFALPAHILASKLWPGVLGERPDTWWGLNDSDHEFVGVAGLATLWLTALALSAPRRPGRRLWIIAGLIGALTALGDSTPFGALLAKLPLLSSARTPTRALVVTVISAAALSADGLAHLARAEASERRRIIVTASAVTASGALLSLAALGWWLTSVEGPLVVGGVPRDVDALLVEIGLPAIAKTLFALAVTVAATLLANSQPRLQKGIAASIVVGAFLGATPAARTISANFYQEDWMGRLPPDARHGRVYVIDEKIPNIERQGGRTLRELSYVDAPWFARALGSVERLAPWMNIAFDVSPPRAAPGEAFSGPWEIDFQRKPTFPEARLFTDAHVGVPDDEVLENLVAGADGLFIADPIEHVPPAREPGSPHAQIYRDLGPNALRIEVLSPGPSWLFVSEKFHPGWEAEIDGDPAPIRRANLTFRAVHVPRGKHTVTMRYRPLGAKLGGLVTLLSLAGALLFIGKHRREARPA